MEEKIKKTGFLESRPGHRSNTRLLSWFFSLYAAFITYLTLRYGFLQKESIVTVVIAATSMFTTIVGVVFTFLGYNKHLELKKTDKNE